MDRITDEHLARSREGYRLFRQQDPAFLDHWDPEIEVHVPDTLPRGGDLRGHAAALEFFAGIAELFEDPAPDPEEFLAANDKLIVLGTWRGTARSTGTRVEIPFAHVWQARDGKWVYFRNYLDAARALRALEAAP